MPEQVLYFGEEYHTGHLREAASELLDQDLRIIEVCADRVRDVNPAISPLKTPTLLRLALSAQNMPEKSTKKELGLGFSTSKFVGAISLI